jgi:hypothetical protein
MEGVSAIRCRFKSSDLAMIDVPVLVMHGEDDQICPFPTTGAKSLKLLKHGTLKSYFGLPHGMPTTHAELINADLLAFIRSSEHVTGRLSWEKTSELGENLASTKSKCRCGAVQFQKRLGGFGRPLSLIAAETAASASRTLRPAGKLIDTPKASAKSICAKAQSVELVDRPLSLQVKSSHSTDKLKAA